MSRAKSNRPVSWQTLLQFLMRNSGTFTYTELALIFDSCARAVGQMVAALGRRGYDDLCPRVVSQRTGRPLKPCRS